MSDSQQLVASEFECELPAAPYPGLRPFEPREWPVYFGREAMADEVIHRIVTGRLLVVHGDSGSGKSSLIYAGVMPHLEQEAARSGVRWRTCSAMPGDHPLGNLARSLAGIDGREEDKAYVTDIRRVLNFGVEGAGALAELLGATATNRVCILVDQFEELFAHAKHHGRHEAKLLTELLIGIQRREAPGLSAVLTMRSEFLGACASFNGFAEAVNTAQYLLPRMEHANLVRAIREPATLFNGQIELSLAENLIADVGGAQDQLPLIQHGLMLLYRDHVLKKGVKPGERWTLTLRTCKGDGRSLSRLLSDHANEIADRWKSDRAVEDVFRALTNINSDGHAVRRPRTLGQLVEVTNCGESVVRAVVDAFRVDGVSFLRPYGTSPLSLDDRVDISHEALIRCWDRIAEPTDGWLIREFKNGLVWRSLLVQADSFDRDPSNVLSPATTEERAAWLQRRNAAWAERYGGEWGRVRKLIDASIAERDRQKAEDERERQREEAARLQAVQLQNKARRMRWLVAGFSVTATLLVVAAILAVFALNERKSALRANALANKLLADVTIERDSNAAARIAAEKRNAELLELLEKFKAEFTALSNVTKGLHTDAAVRGEIDKAQGSLATTVAQISTVATPPRIYIHISEESQRNAARALAARLETSKLDGESIVIPGIQLVDPWKTSELRCFTKPECVEAQKLTDLLNKLLLQPRIIVADSVSFAERYATGTKKLRPRHYELWFAPGAIEVEGSASYKRADVNQFEIKGGAIAATSEH